MSDGVRTAGSWRGVLHRLRGDRRAVLAAATLALMLVLVLAGPLVSAYQPNEMLDIVHQMNQPPAADHLLGTDAFSRDLLARIMSGGRVSLAVAVGAVLVEVLVGVIWGLAAGLAGGTVDTVMMRIVDAGMSVPRVLGLLAVLAAVEQVPVPVFVLLLGLSGWFGIARLVRGEARSVRSADFVLAARALGASPVRVAARHLLPHVTGPLLVAATLAIGNVIVLEAGLSWIGIGVQPPAASWGNIIRDGMEFMATAPWVCLAPGVCLVVVVLAVSALGDGLRDALAPRHLPGP